MISTLLLLAVLGAVPLTVIDRITIAETATVNLPLELRVVSLYQSARVNPSGEHFIALHYIYTFDGGESGDRTFHVIETGGEIDPLWRFVGTVRVSSNGDPVELRHVFEERLE